MTNSSKQSSLIISITWVNACNHGSNCCSEKGLFSHASILATKERPNVQIFALIFLWKYTFFWKKKHFVLGNVHLLKMSKISVKLLVRAHLSRDDTRETWPTSAGQEFHLSAAIWGEGLCKWLPFPPIIVDVNAVGPADSGILSKLVIDDSLTERKLPSYA